MIHHQVIALCGSPRAGSRTAALATEAARRLARVAGLPPDTVRTVDLLPYAPRMFDRSAADVRDLVVAVVSARLVVVASPVFKGSYTGLLKAFLDHLPQAGLAGVTAAPVMTGSLARHSDVPERMLRPLLDELGADTLPGLFVPEEDLDRPGTAVDAWLGRLAGDVHRVADRPVRPTGVRRPQRVTCPA